MAGGGELLNQRVDGVEALDVDRAPGVPEVPEEEHGRAGPGGRRGYEAPQQVQALGQRRGRQVQVRKEKVVLGGGGRQGDGIYIVITIIVAFRRVEQTMTMAMAMGAPAGREGRVGVSPQSDSRSPERQGGKGRDHGGKAEAGEEQRSQSKGPTRNHVAIM